MIQEIIHSLAPLRIFLRPAIVLLLLWSLWLIFIKRDKAMGLALYVGLVIIVDTYMKAIIPLSGVINVEYGSIRYSDPLLLWLLVTDSYQRKSDISLSNTQRKTVLTLSVLWLLLSLYAAFRGFTIGNGLVWFRLVVLKPIISLYIASTGFRDEEDYKKFFVYMVVLGLILSVAVVELKFFDRLFLKGVSYYKPEFWWPIRNSGRIGGFFSNPNNMGNFIVLVIPLHILGLKVFKRIGEKILAFTGLLGLIFALLQTDSRGSFIGGAVSIFLLFFVPLGNTKIRHKIGMALVTSLVFLSFMPGAIEKINRRMDALSLESQETLGGTEDKFQGQTLDDRYLLWEDGIKIGMISPIFGIGLGQANHIILGREMQKKGQVTIVKDHAHSSYINMFIQSGIISVFVFLIMNMIVVRSALETIIKLRNHDLLYVLAGCSIAVVGYLVCIISQNTLYVANASTLYWVLLGIVCALTGRIKYEDFGGEKNTIDS